jgi:DNA (cytosine-5)-methyltransferase 1
MQSFSYIDLFAGIGGFRLALDGVGGKCLFSSEIDKACRAVYLNNFGGEVVGDITSVDEKQIPDHDLLAGGFPCQAFSIAGKKRGFEDARGTLFFEILRIAKAKKTKVLFLENVKNLIHHDSGKTIKTIQELLEQEGYNFRYKILNTKDFGLAQNRERIIIVASRENAFDFDPIEKVKSKPVVVKDIMQHDQSQAFEVLPADDYTIIDKGLWERQKSGLIFVGHRNRSIRKTGVRPNTEHLSRVHKQPNRIYHVDGTHPTLSAQESCGRYWVYDDERVRKMTVKECYALQGFPDDYKIDPVQSNAYRQIGNSVGVPLMRAVGEEIKRQLLS